MWMFVVSIVIAAVFAFHAGRVEQNYFAADDRRAMELAESMALYREAVIRYFTLNDLTDASVSLDALRTAGLLPSWSSLYTHGSSVPWTNYRGADGTIYVYATAAPAVNIQAELAELSRNSLYAGAYRAGAGVLVSPVFGSTGISLAALATRSVPDNAPVWIGRVR